jgi:hypothetical protein
MQHRKSKTYLHRLCCVVLVLVGYRRACLLACSCQLLSFLVVCGRITLDCREAKRECVCVREREREREHQQPHAVGLHARRAHPRQMPQRSKEHVHSSGKGHCSAINNENIVCCLCHAPAELSIVPEGRYSTVSLDAWMPGCLDASQPASTRDGTGC